MSTATIVFEREIKEYDWSGLLGVSLEEVKSKMTEEDWDSIWDELTSTYASLLDENPTPEANDLMDEWWASSESDYVKGVLASYGL